MYHPMTLKELQDRAPFIDWRDHFEDALRLVKRKVTDKEIVVVYAPEYLEKLTKIIEEYSSTSNGKMYVYFERFYTELTLSISLSFSLFLCLE